MRKNEFHRFIENVVSDTANILAFGKGQDATIYQLPGLPNLVMRVTDPDAILDTNGLLKAMRSSLKATWDKRFSREMA